MAALGIAMGCYAVWYPAWGLSLGHPQWAGVAEALMSVAGVLGVFLYEKFVTPAGRTSLHYLGMGLILMASLVLAALSTGIGIILLTSILAGLALTPMNVASYVLVNEKIPAGQHTEVNAAIGSAYNLGSGACALLVGIAFSTFSLRYVVVAVTLIITPLVGAALLGRPIARPAPELVGAQQDGATAQ
jgi:predicted MFS family arabinose efflux permease